MCFWLSPAPLAAIAHDGFFNAVEIDPPRLDRQTAFWHVTFGMLVVIVGALERSTQAQTGTLPLFLDWALFGLSCAGLRQTMIPSARRPNVNAYRRHWYNVGLFIGIGVLAVLALGWQTLDVRQRLLLLNVATLLCHQFEECG